MKVVLLLANSNYSVLPQIKETVIKVLTELEVEVEIIELTQIEYFNNTQTMQMKEVIRSIVASKGVIAICNIPLIGVHATMQNFFDHMSIWEGDVEQKPLFTITYSNWTAEVEGANLINKAWSILGGSNGGNMCLNQYIGLDVLVKSLERSIENFYRIMRQGIYQVPCSEYYTYKETRANKVTFNMPIEHMSFEEKPDESILEHVDEETNQIRELLKQDFVPLNTGVYSKPLQGVGRSNKVKRIQTLPHYFIVKHEYSLDMAVQYIITDTNEKGYLIIRNGDCEYYEGMAEEPTVELSLTDEILQMLMSKQITYQKAFMVGKLKVKGNFVLVSKLDQVFKVI